MSRAARGRRRDRGRNHVAEARTRLRRGDFHEALEQCRQVLERRPDDVPALLLTGTVLDYRRTARERYTATPSAEQGCARSTGPPSDVSGTTKRG